MAQVSNQIRAAQVQTLYEGVNVTEHKFCWDLRQQPGPHHNPTARFIVKAENGDSYQYNWKLTLDNSDSTLKLWLESFSDRNNANNKIFVEVSVASVSGKDTSPICSALTATEEPIDLLTKGRKFEAKIPSNIPTHTDILNNLYGFSEVIQDFSNLQFGIKMQVYWKSELCSSGVSKLCTDFANLYTEQRSADVTFAFNDGKEIKAHKSILMARSPVFRAMFENEMVESRRNRVDIEDVDSDTFDKLILYLYSGKMSTLMAMDKLADLMVAADKYVVDELKNLCETEMKYRINIENAAEVFIISHLYNLDSLKETCIGVIFKGEQEFLQTDGYKNMRKDHPNLAFDMFENLSIYRKGQK